MKTVYLLFPLFFLSPVILLPCSASPNSQLSLPAAIRNTDKQSPELLQLKKLLDDGDIIPFYQAADKMLKEARRYHKKIVTPRELADGLFLCHLITTAPFIDLNKSSNVEWLANYNNIDHKVKEFMSRSIPFAALTDKNVKLPGKEEALRFYLTATAMVLKQFHSQMDYAFEATQICTYMIIDHASGLSTDKATDLFNKTSAQSSRNYDIQSIIKNQDSGFIRELMKCFPAKAVEVKKYLHMAGYEDREIPALLDRTVGRVPQAEYLYRSLPKRRD